MNRILLKTLYNTRNILLKNNGYCFKSAFTVPLRRNIRFYSQQASATDDLHCIIKEKEEVTGDHVKNEFKAETKKLLDIVARSLYSDKEIFIRELVSNANDALEKFRYMQSAGLQYPSKNSVMEIHIKTDENKKLFIIQDTGIGMSKEEMINNLGTIARSGSQEFIEKLEDSKNSSIIGKFGVGFYSSFMVSDKVDVYSRAQNSPKGFHWESTSGDGSFKVCEAKNVDEGTKLVLHLKKDCEEFCDEKVVEEILTKYSSYINNPVYLNGRKLSMMKPVWLKDPSTVTESEYEEFFQYKSGHATDVPRYTLSFKIDVPIDIKALFYFPSRKPSLYEISRESDAGVSLYCRKVMIMNRTQKLIPSWLRFLCGVVESDDIPLNLSRELLQDSALISKINRVISGKVIRFLLEQSHKDPEKYNSFYCDYGLYLKEGIINTFDNVEKEKIASLLRFETNMLESGKFSSLQEYGERMKAGTRKIYYLSAPNRQLAETSPYMEAIRKNKHEVIFLYEPYDEIVLMQLGKFENKTLVSVESELEPDAVPENSESTENKEGGIDAAQSKKLIEWAEEVLKPNISRARISSGRLGSHPCAVTVKDIGSVRYFMKTAYSARTDAEKFALMNATLELNSDHSLIQSLSKIQVRDDELAKKLLRQLFQNALIHAGLASDSRSMVDDLNDLLTKAFSQI